MSDVEDIKKLFDSQKSTVADLRSEVDALSGKAADFVDADRVKRIEEGLAAQISALTAKNAEIEERAALLEVAANRPEAGKGSDEDLEMKGTRDFMAGREVEQKGMLEGSGPDGGFLVQPTMRAGIQARMRRWSPVRAIAGAQSISGMSYEILVERGDAGAEWVAETSARNDTDAPTFNKINIALHELSAKPKITQRLLDDAAFDLGAYVTTYLGERFGRKEGSAFITGDGVARPKGFLSYSVSTADDHARASGALQYVFTGTSGGFNSTNPADKFIDLFYAVQAAYRVGASWAMNSRTMATAHKFKGGDGNYLLQSMMNGDGTAVSRILGKPITELEDMPDAAADSLSVAFGDFRSGYTIIDSGAVRMLRDPYTSKPHVQFYTTKRVGGGVTDFDAIKLMKLGTS